MSFISAAKEVLVHAEGEFEPLSSYNLHRDEATCAVFNHNAHVFASGGVDGVVQLYHIEKEFTMMSLIEEDTTVGLAALADNRT